MFSSFPFLRGASAIITHYDTACALKNGRIRCARRDDGGSSRWIVEGIHDALNFDFCGNHGCAFLADGRVKCWGSNQYGELGNGTTGGYYLPGKPATEVVDLMP